MKKHITTSEVDMQFEIEADALRITVKVIDSEVFPPLDADNSAKMARLTHQLNGAILNALSARAYQVVPEDEVPATSDIKTVKYGEQLQCPRCGARAHYKAPCCGSDVTHAVCANKECNWRQPIRVVK